MVEIWAYLEEGFEFRVHGEKYKVCMYICVYVCIYVYCIYVCIYVFHLSDAASSTSFATFISIEVCLFNMRRRGNTHSHTAYTYYIQCSQKVFAGQ